MQAAMAKHGATYQRLFHLEPFSWPPPSFQRYPCRPCMRLEMSMSEVSSAMALVHARYDYWQAAPSPS